MLTCVCCGVEKDDEQFSISRNKISGRRSKCKDCINTYERNKRIAAGMNVMPIKEKFDGKKICLKCGELKDFELFPVINKKMGYRSSYCKVCANKIRENSRKLKGVEPIRQRAKWLKSSFGISVDQYNDILLLQDNKCAICGRTEELDGKNFAVDHDHKTGKMRGILCKRCNLLLGKFENSTGNMEGAISYLQKYGGTSINE